MLFVLLLSVNAATATRPCWEAPDKLDLPSCTVRDKYVLTEDSLTHQELLPAWRHEHR
jgi:hypothetical protein